MLGLKKKTIECITNDNFITFASTTDYDMLHVVTK